MRSKRDCDKALGADQINRALVNYWVSDNWMKYQASDIHSDLTRFYLLSAQDIAGGEADEWGDGERRSQQGHAGDRRHGLSHLVP